MISSQRGQFSHAVVPVVFSDKSLGGDACLDGVEGIDEIEENRALLHQIRCS